MEEITTGTLPVRYLLARFASESALNTWLRDHPTFRFIGRLIYEKRSPGEFAVALAEYATAEDKSRAAGEDALVRAAVRRSYLATFRKTKATLHSEEDLEKLEAAKLRLEKADREAKLKARISRKWSQLVKTPAGRRQYADWRAEALERNRDLAPGEIAIDVPPPIVEDVI